jgi:hypothetical protein
VQGQGRLAEAKAGRITVIVARDNDRLQRPDDDSHSFRRLAARAPSVPPTGSLAARRRHAHYATPRGTRQRRAAE